MDNFFTGNPDILWEFDHADLNEIINALEDGFNQAGTFEEAPESPTEALSGYRDILELVGAIAAQEAQPLASEIDEEGVHLKDGKVSYAKGTQRLLEVFSKSGLMGFTLPRRYGGLNLPNFVYSIAIEMVSQADASFMNLFGLQATAEIICEYADDEIKDKYLPRFAAGEVTGAMILTEPDAGSDLQAVKLKAVPQQDNTWKLYGVKRFITNGCADVSLVLARTEEGSADARGLSMLLCEKCPELVVRRVEDKHGIHGSPTCELQFNGVPAVLIGRRRMGLIRYVMALMNGARVAVAAQALGIAQAAYEEAYAYAKERAQFKRPVLEFPQVYDMLTRMKSSIQAARAITCETSRLVDLRRAFEKKMQHNGGGETRAQAKKLRGLTAVLTPLAKAYASETSTRVTYDAVQVHGGVGYMRDFTVERLARDARITPIYEGTTQLQVLGALPGITRGVLTGYLGELADQLEKERAEGVSDLADLCQEARNHLQECLDFLKEFSDSSYTQFVSRKLADLACDCLGSHLLLRQAAKDEAREPAARKFIKDALPRIRMNTDYIKSGDRYAIDHRGELL